MSAGERGKDLVLQRPVNRWTLLGTILSALLSLGPRESSTITDACPGGHYIRVTHITQGRTQETSDLIREWIAKVEDRGLAGLLQDAFKGKICRDDMRLLRALNEMALCRVPELRSEAVHVLCNYDVSRVIEPVRAALADKSPEVRMRALSCVEFTCDKGVLPQLKALIAGDKCQDVLDYARQVAERLEGRLPCVQFPSSDEKANE